MSPAPITTKSPVEGAGEGVRLRGGKGEGEGGRLAEGGGAGARDPPAEAGGVMGSADAGGDEGNTSEEDEMTSCGGADDSRLMSLIAVEFVVVRAKLTWLVLRRREVTSHSTHVPPRTGPAEPMTERTLGLLR